MASPALKPTLLPAGKCRWLVVTLILCGCAPKSSEDFNLAFDRARDSLQAGDLDHALGEADRGFRLAIRRQDLHQQWRFRLLRCNVLALNRRPEEIMAELADPIPEGPAFAVLAARKTMLEGQAQAMLGQQARAEALLDKAHRAAEASGAEDLLLDIEI